MTQQDINPYSPPSTGVLTSAGNQTARSKTAFVLVLIVTILYHLLILLLLTSPPDRIPAMILLLNTPTTVIWLIRLKRRHPNVTMPGVVGAGVQVIIGMALMLNKDAERGPIAVMCATIILAFLILAYICGRLTRNKIPTGAESITLSVGEQVRL